MTSWHARLSQWLLALTVALTPCRGRAYEDEDAGPLCDESRPILAGEESDCDGVVIGPKRLGALLQEREELAVCRVDLGLARKLGELGREHCDARLERVTAALLEANARLLQPPRWQWDTALVGFAVGLVVGASLTAYVATR